MEYLSCTDCSRHAVKVWNMCDLTPETCDVCAFSGTHCATVFIISDLKSTLKCLPVYIGEAQFFWALMTNTFSDGGAPVL